MLKVIAGIALLPYALYVILSRRLLRSVYTAFAALTITLVPLVIADRLFYSKWTVRISTWTYHRISLSDSCTPMQGFLC